MMVTRLAWMAHKFASSISPMMYDSVASCSASSASACHRRGSRVSVPATSLTWREGRRQQCQRSGRGGWRDSSTHQPCKRKLANEQVCRALELPNLLQRSLPRSVPPLLAPSPDARCRWRHHAMCHFGARRRRPRCVLSARHARRLQPAPQANARYVRQGPRAQLLRLRATHLWRARWPGNHVAAHAQQRRTLAARPPRAACPGTARRTQHVTERVAKTRRGWCAPRQGTMGPATPRLARGVTRH